MSNPVVHNRRLKLIEFTLGAAPFECQVKEWNFDPGVKDGEREYTFCPGGEFITETDPEPTLELKFFADWRSGGISDYLTAHSGETAGFVLNHHPNIVGEHVRWTGDVVLKAPKVGGERRSTEMTEVTLLVVGVPTYERV
jgi:hypothetical protein